MLLGLQMLEKLFYENSSQSSRFLVHVIIYMCQFRQKEVEPLPILRCYVIYGRPLLFFIELYFDMTVRPDMFFFVIVVEELFNIRRTTIIYSLFLLSIHFFFVFIIYYISQN